MGTKDDPTENICNNDRIYDGGLVCFTHCAGTHANPNADNDVTGDVYG